MERLSIDTENRTANTFRLAEALNMPPPELSGRAQSFETRKNEHIPTIGAEIEIRWSSILPDHERWFNEPYNEFSKDKQEAFNRRCDEIDAYWQPLYQAATAAGVPKGNDQYHEFALHYAHWHETLAAEIAVLSEAGLIPGNHDSPMHVTIGGMPFDKEAGIAAALTELYGGSNPARLIQPSQESLAWARAGSSGIKSRRAGELEGDYESGFEIRTLVANTPEQIGGTLRCIQLLSAAIRANKLSDKHETDQRLSTCWESIKETTEENLLKPYGLNRWLHHPARNKIDWEKLGSLYSSCEMAGILNQLDRVLDDIDACLTSRL